MVSINVCRSKSAHSVEIQTFLLRFQAGEILKKKNFRLIYEMFVQYFDAISLSL